MLTLPIKKKWFDMILSGEKKEEYREIKPYYTTRFSNEVGWHVSSSVPVIYIKFRNGYSSQSPSFIARCSFWRGEGKVEWGAEPNKKYYVLGISKIMEEEND